MTLKIAIGFDVKQQKEDIAEVDIPELKAVEEIILALLNKLDYKQRREFFANYKISYTDVV